MRRHIRVIRIPEHDGDNQAKQNLHTKVIRGDCRRRSDFIDAMVANDATHASMARLRLPFDVPRRIMGTSRRAAPRRAVALRNAAFKPRARSRRREVWIFLLPRARGSHTCANI